MTLSILPRLPFPPCWAVGKPHGKEIVTRSPRCRRAAWPGRFSGRADNLEDIKAGRKGTLLLAGWAEGPGEGLVTGEKSKQGGSQSKQPLPAPASPHRSRATSAMGRKDAVDELRKGKALSLGPVGPRASAGLGIGVG